MRIADNTITRNYLNNLSTNTEHYYEASQKVSSGRSYEEASDDPAAAIQAMKVRSTLSKIDTYQGNINEITGLVSERESVLSEINSIVTEAQDQVLQGKSGTYNATNRQTIANTLKSYQDTILSLGNQMYCDKYIFGGSSDYTKPFSVDASGNLLYQGQNVDTGTFGTEAVYSDIGLGVEGSTAYNISSPGSTLLGTGTTSGVTNNLYNLLGVIATAFSNNDLSNISTYSNRLETLGDNILVQYTAVGQESSYISLINDRLTTAGTNAITRDNSLEKTDTAKASIEYSEESTAYQATLQVGAKLIQKSLLDYLN